MNKLLLAFALSLSVASATAQSSAGLVAHWDMNNTVTDVSGNGHNGHMNNLVAAPGLYGTPNTAYYFDGTTSYISVPYAPTLQLSQYSICAIVKPTTFYSGACQANIILARGFIQTPGSYCLQFNDNPNDANDCSLYDSTQEVFLANAGTTGSGGPGIHNWAYTPTIQSNNWYKVIATWDGTKYKIFVNDTLKTTLVSVTGGTFGTSTDSIAIGLDLFNMAVPFGFTGYMDDIRIYDRPLADTEVSHYGADTCGRIVAQPDSVYVAAGATTRFRVVTNMGTPTYQWQLKSGLAYVNLTNTAPYSGVTSDTLKVAGVTATMNHNLYRCVVQTGSGCSDTTLPGQLKLPTMSINDVTADQQITVYPNPAHDKINVMQGNERAVVEMLNPVGQVVLHSSVDKQNTQVDVSGLSNGVYIIRVSAPNFVRYQQFIKN